MNMRDIEKIMVEILLRRSEIDFCEKPELQNEKLLGNKILMPARELLHVYFDVEAAFGITIPDEDIVSGRFDTFRHITEIVEKQRQLQPVTAK